MDATSPAEDAELSAERWVTDYGQNCNNVDDIKYSILSLLDFYLKNISYNEESLLKYIFG